MSNPVNLRPSGPPETVLPPADAGAASQLAAALQLTEADQRAAIAEVVSENPRFMSGWAELGDRGRDTIEAYAAYRVGYHRGLDALRANGWRGSGYVRWSHESNRGFLRALAGLARTAQEIGETDEWERCELFLRQLDPGWPPSDGTY